MKNTSVNYEMSKNVGKLARYYIYSKDGFIDSISHGIITEFKYLVYGDKYLYYYTILSGGSAPITLDVDDVEIIENENRDTG
jgi:hypothetical protein